MATNKFATMLHNRTNKITLILVYAILEWILIILLLLNSLFSYLIIKFADYFGLKRPCLWCSRVDHVLDPQNRRHSYKELVCESHAHEISKLGYCSHHRKLAESQNMCEGCSSFSKQNGDGDSRKITFMIREGSDEMEMGENGEAILKCSCCDVSLEMGSKYYYSPYFVIKPNWGVLDRTQKANLITEAGMDDEIKEGAVSEQSRSDFAVDHFEEGQGFEQNPGGNGVLSVSYSDCDEKAVESSEDDEAGVVIGKEKEKEPSREVGFDVSMEDPSCDSIPQHLEYYIDNGDFRLIPVGLIDPTTVEKENESKSLMGDQENCDHREALLASELQRENEIEMVSGDKYGSGETVAALSAGEIEENPQFAVLESLELGENRNSSILLEGEGDLVMELLEEDSIPQATQNGDDDQLRGGGGDGHINPECYLASEKMFQLRANDTLGGISIGAEIADQDRVAEVQTQDDVIASHPCVQGSPSTGSSKLYANDDHCSKQAEEGMAECKTIPVEETVNNHNCMSQIDDEMAECKINSAEVSDQTLNNHKSMILDHREIEEEKVFHRPISVDQLPMKMRPLPEKREGGAVESLDGSVVSEFESVDGVLTVESLKSVLRSERKALNEVYMELEEERSASAVAANETMAMINRLQEEKAAMQMEALQYQRMMEEQSEYDQEALQLLNELMVKREREKQELEKELEIYRKKVMDYEAKEKIMMLRRMRDGSTRSRNSTASCSNAEDSDGLSIDLNQEGKEEESFYSHQESCHHNTPTDVVLNLDESLANFEDERILILEQLRVLEEKLFSLADEEERHFEDMKPFEQFYEESGKEFQDHLDSSIEPNGVANGVLKEISGNGKHQQEEKQESRVMGSNSKRLLPLFDAVSAEETEDGVMNGNEQPFQVTKFELETKKLAIEEEVDHLYDRLHALEADREFLKHCVGSLKKGDKGIDLLQEILQHLRDLRNVELRVKNVGDNPLL